MNYPAVKFIRQLALVAALVSVFGAAYGATTDIANVPMAAGDDEVSPVPVKPNIMFVLDDSGSMESDYTPDYIKDDDTCKEHDSSDRCKNGDPPTYASQYNNIYYNPEVNYLPALQFDGSSMGSQTITATQTDPFLNAGSKVNLTTKYPEQVYCDSSAQDNCRRNGIDSTVTPFEYRESTAANSGRTLGYPEQADITLYDAGNTNIVVNPSNCLTSSTTVPRICRASNVITVSLSADHNLVAGDRVIVSSCDNAYETGGNPVAVTIINSRRFSYADTGTTTGNSSCKFVRPAFKYQEEIAGSPFYYTIAAKEYCSDEELTTCVLASAPSGSNIFPAPVRFCRDRANAHLGTAVSGGSPISCRSKYNDTYKYPRYGKFARVDIVSSRANYPRGPKRIDCTGTVGPTGCTYAQEAANFANWYAYYRTRMLMMKSAAGIAFKSIDERYRVGFITINPTCENNDNADCGSSVRSDKYLKITDFDSAQKKSWYNLFYSQYPDQATPLREALSRVGWIYGRKLNTGLTKGIPVADDPMQYSCQQNFTILTTDGYWNGNGGKDLDNNNVGNEDNNITIAPRPMWDSGSTGSTTTTTTTENYFLGASGGNGCSSGRRKILKNVTTAVNVQVQSGSAILSSNTTTTTNNNVVHNNTCSSSHTLPTPNPKVSVATSNSGATGGSSNSLADVAMYYYNTDLRPDGTVGSLGVDVSKDEVRGGGGDTAAHQHMTTFTLGVVDGELLYKENYEDAAAGDFADIKSGLANWPLPAADKLSALDDLWHAAVNGRGTFYLAKDPAALTSGLTAALSGVAVRDGAAASSATSSPNVTPTDNLIFSSTYTTGEWTGQVFAEEINPDTGEVITEPRKWEAQALLDAKVGTASDTRKILMFDSVKSNKLDNFLYADMTTAEKAWFANQCSTLSQCSDLLYLLTYAATANNGTNMVNYLRGQTQHEGAVYRDRAHVLGDTVNATPQFLREPRFAFADATSPKTYADYKAENASREPTLFIAANDGMLHALHGNTGDELWGYVPRIVMPSMRKLADKLYAEKHAYLVDGSPSLMDVYIGGAWKTILVAGLNSGGRGYYALDVTEPTNPKGLWEICNDASLCAITDADMGLSYGIPVITKRPTDGKWVVLVTSGYNNVSPGSGIGYLYVLDAATGAVLEKISTGAGNTTTPSGLGQIAAWADNGNIDNTARWVYGGDLRGNLWRFDLQTSPATVLKIGELKDSVGRPQSVTTRPELAQIQGNRVVYFGTGRYLGISDLADPATWSPASTDAYQQSLYAIKDSDTAYGNIRTNATPVQQVLSALSSTTRTITQKPMDWGSHNSWYLDFNPGDTTPGERVNINPNLVLGTLQVTTNVPGSTACVIGGDSWGYQFNFETGSFLSTATGGLVGSKLGSAITVGVVIVRLPSGQLKAISTDASGKKTTFGVNIGGSAASGKRTSWRELLD